MYIHRILTYIIAITWFINGLFCKLLNMVPRHQEIVASILGTPNASLLTKLIGISEIAMAAWILSGIARRLNTWTQVIIIAVMNTLEFILTPHLLLWGRMNAVFACILILLILYNEFYLNRSPHKPV
ncbi:MAG: DoxX-like family protein [Rhizobacter sp.]|nr:DoxX-like family protein [Ferruginibacter sp.]